MILKFEWNHQRPRIAKGILRKYNSAEGIMLPDFKIYFKAIVIKIEWNWHKNRYIDPWNRIETPEINPCIYGQLMYDKATRIYSGELTISSVNTNKWYWENWRTIWNNTKLTSYTIHKKLIQTELKTWTWDLKP